MAFCVGSSSMKTENIFGVNFVCNIYWSGLVGYYVISCNVAAETDEPDNEKKHNDDDAGVDNYDKRPDFRQEQFA